jgi:hypothetical protein
MMQALRTVASLQCNIAVVPDDVEGRIIMAHGLRWKRNAALSSVMIRVGAPTALACICVR